jgi:hypothetical protein
MKQLIYRGFIEERCKGENDDALFIGDMEYPLAEEFESELQGKQVSVRYWISDTKKTKEQIQRSALKTIMGVVDADYGDRYSEITGYLWTDEELNIGGHDLRSELSCYKGKFVYLEIDVH